MIQWSLQAKFCLGICCDDRDTVAGRNPAPPVMYCMYETSWKMGYSQCQLVQDFDHLAKILNEVPRCPSTVPRRGRSDSGWIDPGRQATARGHPKRMLENDPVTGSLRLVNCIFGTHRFMIFEYKRPTWNCPSFFFFGMLNGYSDIPIYSDDSEILSNHLYFPIFHSSFSSIHVLASIYSFPPLANLPWNTLPLISRTFGEDITLKLWWSKFPEVLKVLLQYNLLLSKNVASTLKPLHKSIKLSLVILNPPWIISLSSTLQIPWIFFLLCLSVQYLSPKSPTVRCPGRPSRP